MDVAGLADQELIGQLMKRFRQGESGAAGQLVEALYPELRRLAAQKMRREPNGHSWQPTLLVHEVYLELLRLKGFPLTPETDQNDVSREKATFLKLAGLMMQRRLIDHAKPRFRKMPKLSVDSDGVSLPEEAGLDALVYVENLLNNLASVDARLRTVVEGRVFLGMTLAELGTQLQCSERTAATYWSFARQWLADELDRSA